ncbi:uncharacterized protein CCOS01_15251 [Colletotrichum costaricense]|uniref:Uncharacterized protein n=1 Tax=Colletotrichum costaricense TaxID=1209916 RepID=A0AAI9YHL7_9PEZI|nr:uncharacterized protein CCOS01_15251 [Colletotrichum costaricense]KAK1510420.1 hypothetical protein CCOS01_15251 [Colletotrichum costaricense]
MNSSSFLLGTLTLPSRMVPTGQNFPLFCTLCLTASIVPYTLRSRWFRSAYLG